MRWPLYRVAVAERSGHDCPAEQAVALEAEEQLRDAVRRLRPHQPAADAQRGEIRLVTGALGDLRGAADQTLGVERGADDGLGIEIDYRTLLLRDCQAGKVPRGSGVVEDRAMLTRTGPKLFAILAGNAPLADMSVSPDATSSLPIRQR